MSDPALADWISQYVTFPNSMVDGIVPVTSDRERQLVLDKFGIEDLAPVTSETYRQWVVEDRFAAGRPSLEKVGVTFSDDVAKYERMKIRILNGGHAIITYPSALMDLEIVSDAMANPLIHAFFRKVETTEVLPHVDPIPDVTPAKYLDLIDGRFSNTAIVDTTRRLGFDGSSRQPKFILSSVADGLAAGSPVTGLALVSACWARYCAGKTDSGVSITANDPDWDRLKQLSLQARAEPLAWLSLKEVYGNVATDGRFAAAFAKWLPMLWERGTANTLGAYLADC
jgi:mannitol 2-dehydrogenase